MPSKAKNIHKNSAVRSEPSNFISRIEDLELKVFQLEKEQSNRELDDSNHALNFIPDFTMGRSINSNTRGNINRSAEKVRKYLYKSRKFLGLYVNEMSSSQSNFGLNYGEDNEIEMDPVFESMFHPNDMRLLALVSHNNMKDAMKQFVLANRTLSKSSA